MRTLLWDLSAFGGFGLIIAGLAVIYPPAILLFVGGCLFTAGVWGAWKSR